MQSAVKLGPHLLMQSNGEGRVVIRPTSTCTSTVLTTGKQNEMRRAMYQLHIHAKGAGERFGVVAWPQSSLCRKAGLGSDQSNHQLTSLNLLYPVHSLPRPCTFGVHSSQLPHNISLVRALELCYTFLGLAFTAFTLKITSSPSF